MNTDDEPEGPGLARHDGAAGQAAGGWHYLRSLARCGRRRAGRSVRKGSCRAGSGRRREHAEACLFQSVVTVGADVLLVAATAVDQPPDQMVAKLQDTYGRMEVDD